MIVTVADTAGFCMGVSRAVEIAKAEVRHSDSNVYTLGELIHNRQVVEELAGSGIEISTGVPESGTVIIRAHGVSQKCKEQLLHAGLKVVDATCPHVLSSQKMIARYSASGGAVVISGDPEHPEVEGLCGYAVGDVLVVDSLAAVEKLELPEKFLFISQTTFSLELFENIANKLQELYPLCTVVNSICSATEERQREAKELAEMNDFLVVVGGKNSANTLRLVEIAIQAGCLVGHVESAAEIADIDFHGAQNVAVTAGASTPASSIASVVEMLQAMK